MNTPEQTTKNNHIDENKQEYINKLQTQLGQNDIRRVVQGRDYGRILRDYNTPAQWYKVSSTPRSIYFYDPHYQKYLQQQRKLSTDARFIPPPIRVVNQSKSRTTYSFNSSNLSHYHPQRSILPSRLQSIPKLPPIIIHKKENDE